MQSLFFCLSEFVLFPSTPAFAGARRINVPESAPGRSGHILAFDQSLAAVDLPDLEVLFLKTSSSYKSYLLQLISESETLQDKFITVADSSNGLIFLTGNKNLLQAQLKKLEELS